MGRSLRISKVGLGEAEKAFRLKGWTQEYLAGASGSSRPTVINFFARKPVEKRFFYAFCSELGLEWSEIAEIETNDSVTRSLSIDELIQSVRDNIYGSIYEKCGFMRVLDMSQPIELDDIYTKVNILEKITGRRRLSISELSEQAGIQNFERFSLSRVKAQRVPGLEAVQQHSKLMILGKPGAGKTTFLKRLAVQCVEGQFRPELVPLFITLKDFAEAPGQPSLLSYLIQLFKSHGVELDTQVEKDILTTLFSSNASPVELLLKQGRILILLDGLDEVRRSDTARILNQIQAFTHQYYKNPFIVTCRIAAKEYTFGQFTEVEIADFDEQQVKTFVTKWFQSKQDITKGKAFIGRLERDRSIRELTSSPILLTLLCLVFEDASTFPSNRSELYKEGLDILLKKWDAKRNIERDKIYRGLSLKRKEDLLSQIAANTFESGDYFFKQKAIEREISAYIRNLPGANTDEEALLLDSEAVLKSIEAQHGLLIERAKGIYSFSHLTFHEYFAARNFVTSSKSDIFQQRLFPHLIDRRWQEVLLLTVSMMENADQLLQGMKEYIDNLVANDSEIQQLLTWLQQKSSSMDTCYKPATVRAYYLTHEVYLATENDLSVALTNDHDLTFSLIRDYDLSRSSDQVPFDTLLATICNRRRGGEIHRAHQYFERVFAADLEPELKQALQIFKNELPSKKSTKQFKQWCETEGPEWTERLRKVLIQYRNIGHDWQIVDERRTLLGAYYKANKLLVDCLNSDCYVSREVRQDIEDHLLLPYTDMDKLEIPLILLKSLII